MVVFTCNSCGDSLQKPKVEKHYASVCRSSKNLTCVDCLKDFKGEAYAAHIKCVTEKERYSAKGTVTNVVGKGEAKQQQWSDMISEIVQTNSNVTGSQKLVFEMVSNHIANVPRKKMKFLNFIKSAGGNKIMYADIEAVWDIIEKHKLQQVSHNASDSKIDEEIQSKTDENLEIPKKKKRKTKNEEGAVCNNEENKTISEVLEENVPKKKKKKTKNNEENSANLQKETEAAPEVETTNATKKRKSKKSISLDTSPSLENGTGNDQEKKAAECEVNGKKKNDFQLIEFVKAREAETPKKQTSDDNTAVELNAQKKKKRKSKCERDIIENNSTTEINGGDTANCVNVDNSVMESELNSQKKKKRKSKGDQENVENNSATEVNGGVAANQTNEARVKSKKKKDSSLQRLQNTESSQINSETNDINGSLDNSQKEAVVTANGNGDKEKEITSENTSNSTEPLQTIILKVLQKKDNVSLLKLQKKVSKQVGGADTVNFAKIFKKKLLKLKNRKVVEIVDDENVRLTKIA